MPKLRVYITLIFVANKTCNHNLSLYYNSIETSCTYLIFPFQWSVSYTEHKYALDDYRVAEFKYISSKILVNNSHCRMEGIIPLHTETYQQRGKIHHSGPWHPAAAAGPSSVLAAGTGHTPAPQGCLSLGPAGRRFPLARPLTNVAFYIPLMD